MNALQVAPTQAQHSTSTGGCSTSMEQLCNSHRAALRMLQVATAHKHNSRWSVLLCACAVGPPAALFVCSSILQSAHTALWICCSKLQIAAKLGSSAGLERVIANESPVHVYGAAMSGTGFVQPVANLLLMHATREHHHQHQGTFGGGGGIHPWRVAHCNASLLCSFKVNVADACMQRSEWTRWQDRLVMGSLWRIGSGFGIGESWRS